MIFRRSHSTTTSAPRLYFEDELTFVPPARHRAGAPRPTDEVTRQISVVELRALVGDSVSDAEVVDCDDDGPTMRRGLAFAGPGELTFEKRPCTLADVSRLSSVQSSTNSTNFCRSS